MISGRTVGFALNKTMTSICEDVVVLRETKFIIESM
jgi:hypothetical protein